MPPRSRTAIFRASIRSFWALLLWRACLDRAWPRTKGSPAWAHRSAVRGTSPVPRTEAFHGDDDSLPIGGNDLQKRLWARLHSAVDHNLAGMVQETDGHDAGMQVDATV